MNLFGLFAVLITVTAILSYLNERFLGLPPTIGVMASALCVSVALIGLGHFSSVVDPWVELFSSVDFSAVLMKGMLSFLLFAGALHLNLQDLLRRKWPILSLATAGVLLSTFLVGTLFYFLLRVLGFEMSYVYALVFGALISPTDPIAVMGILREAGAPKTLETLIIGESLFNDGVGVVVFTLVAGLAVGGHEATFLGVGQLFVKEAVGGAVLGWVLGFVTYRMLRSIDNHSVELLITLAAVSGGYVLAGKLHTSGPIAMVIAGLFIGNHGRAFGMSERTRENLDRFWELIDEVLNAILFVMIGLEVVILRLSAPALALGAVAVVLVLAVRYACVALPVRVSRELRAYGPRTAALMTWGGIRGAISIALALSLPVSPERSLILVVTYVVVVFSILVQGLTVGRVVRWATS